MGCGCSSLKGDDVPNVNSVPTTVTDPAMEPAKRINTNFSAIDYDQQGDTRGRRMTEYAPEEITQEKHHDHQHSSDNENKNKRPAPDSQGATDRTTTAASLNGNLNTSISDTNNTSVGGYPHEAADPLNKHTEHNHIHHHHDEELKPYRTLSGGDWDTDERQQQHHHQVNGTRPDPNQGPDPTSSLSKDEFATHNDPANPENQTSHHSPSSRSSSRKKHSRSNGGGANGADDVAVGEQRNKSSTWLGQKYAAFQQAKRGEGVQVSDDELKKYTGKDRAELKRWADSQPGVAGNQGAGTPGSYTGLASGAPWVAGTG
ncbi:hypothetical protein KCU88_g6096, partial [Aureobasidium melanogenum]